MTREELEARPAGRVLDTASTAIAVVEWILSAVARMSLLLIMLIVFADVVMRYAFHAPLSWPYTVIGNYLMVSVFFLMLSNTLHANHHIAIDVFQNMFPLRMRETLQATGFLASALIMGLIAWQSYLRWWTAFRADERLAANIPWPTWIAYAILTIGVAVFVLRIVHRALQHFAAAWSGVPLVASHSANPDVTAIESTHAAGDERNEGRRL
jgi:TRAP-type C4-dicarboxylate transport system permease small subunit